MVSAFVLNEAFMLPLGMHTVFLVAFCVLKDSVDGLGAQRVEKYSKNMDIS